MRVRLFWAFPFAALYSAISMAALDPTDVVRIQATAGFLRDGGVGVWGQIPMPANPQVSAEEATKLVNWVLGQK